MKSLLLCKKNNLKLLSSTTANYKNYNNKEKKVTIL